MRFTGSYQELQEKLGQLNQAGKWVVLNPNQKQFHYSLGGLFNWYPSTGTISFQGPKGTIEPLEQIVQALLNDEPPPVSEAPQAQAEQATTPPPETTTHDAADFPRTNGIY